MPSGSAWIDTGALLALASPRDQYHSRAQALAKRFVTEGGHWSSSVLVLGEFHRQMLYRGGPVTARSVVADVLNDPAYRWLDVSATLAAAALNAWLERFHDQAFTLTDAVSFELMKREGLTEAFAFDQHFLVAGFQLLQ